MTMLFLITRSRRQRRSENIAFPFIVKSLPGSREARRIISIILWQSTLLVEEKHFLHFFSLRKPTSNWIDEEKSTAVIRNEEDDTYNEKTGKRVKKKMTILFPRKMCLIMMTVSSIVVEYVSVKIINSTCYRQSACSQQKKILHFFFYTLTHAGLARKRKRREEIVLLRFGFNGEERKKNVFCIILSKRWILELHGLESWKHRG